MTADQLKCIFEKDYNREDWRNALQEIFHIKYLLAVPQPVNLGANDFDAKAFELGYFETAEGFQVGLYEVSISPEKRLDLNKVGLRNLMRNVYQNDGDAALIVFTQEHTWRFTYASDLTIVNKETGLREHKQTDPKRYTYVLGQNRHCRTAIERFSELKSRTDLFNDARISIDEIEKAFSVETLTKQFYKELFDWYQWALSNNDGFAVTFPNDTSIETDDRRIDEHIIRLITRLMFVWFVKQKNLVPDQIFQMDSLKSILKEFDPYSKTAGNYYNAILQNFFFATLNKAIEERDFTKDGDYNNRREHYGIKSLFRNPRGDSWFKISNDSILNIFSKVPFLNGGLFECLDKEQDSNGKIVYHDGFSREAGRQRRAFIPNCLFFDPAKGLIPLLEKYNFTIEESTPIDVEVALDPELLGKVFENLLGAFNPETKETARKQSGSFYTPREIVNYMVDESLIAYLNTKCPEISKEQIRLLLIPDNGKVDFHETERRSLITAVKSVKILDPACGSGAFPMGVLNKMVDLLQKLEDEEASTPYQQKLHLIENCIYGIDIQTIAVQISKLRFFISLVSDQVTNSSQEDNYGITPLPNLETKFVAANTLIGLEKDFTDSLDLGYTEIRELKDQLWDIRSKHFSARNASEKQNLRKQDEKLRKEIQALLVDLTSTPDTAKIERLEVEIESLKTEKDLYQGENLVDLIEPSIKQGELFDLHAQIEQLTVKIDKNKEERKRIDKLIKEKQKEIEKEISKTTNPGFENEAKQLAKWDPYDQNTSSPFFDAEWMFDVNEGFDIVIGNPPYVDIKGLPQKDVRMYFNLFKTAENRINLYSIFIEKAVSLLHTSGILTFINPNSLLINESYKKIRKLIVGGVEQIIKLPDSVFEAATVETIILLTRKKSAQQLILGKYFNSNDSIDFKNIAFNSFNRSMWLQDVDSRFNIFSENSVINLLKKIEYSCQPLEKYVFTSLGITPYDKYKGHSKELINSRGFHSHFPLTNQYVPLISGKNIHHYYITEEVTEYLKYGNWLGAPREIKFFEGPKIIVRQIVEGKSLKIIAGYSENPKYFTQIGFSLISKVNDKNELKYILCLLNSNLISFYHKNRFLDIEKVVFQKILIVNCKLLPIRNKVNYLPFIKIANIILKKKNSNPDYDTKTLEHKIDEMVYKLYELTYEEVKIVDRDFWLSEEEYRAIKLEE